MRRMDVVGLGHLAHRRLGAHGEEGTDKEPRGMMYPEGLRRAGRRWRISTERGRLRVK